MEKAALFWLSPACVKPYLASAFCGRQAFLRILTAAKPRCERQFWHCQISRNVSNQAKTAKKAHQGISSDLTRRQSYQKILAILGDASGAKQLRNGGLQTWHGHLARENGAISHQMTQGITGKMPVPRYFATPSAYEGIPFFS
jgi:hypothetical protein